MNRNCDDDSQIAIKANTYRDTWYLVLRRNSILLWFIKFILTCIRIDLEEKTTRSYSEFIGISPKNRISFIHLPPGCRSPCKTWSGLAGENPPQGHCLTKSDTYCFNNSFTAYRRHRRNPCLLMCANTI
jgi:hypothetical protein